MRAGGWSAEQRAWPALLTLTPTLSPQREREQEHHALYSELSSYSFILVSWLQLNEIERKQLSKL